MLKYLVIILSNRSTSYCYYDVPDSIAEKTISTDKLKEAILFGMKENLIIVLTDINVASQSLISDYRSWLIEFANNGFKELCMESNRIPQLNIISDRLNLKAMNNCNAGVDTLTVGPDGKFYICPGFYYDGSESVGDPADGLNIRNGELLKLDHAPICKVCDAWQCKRCVWSNLHRTHEINTPGRGQCLISHCEREASRQLLSSLKDNGIVLPDTQIETIDYNEPFETLTR